MRRKKFRAQFELAKKKRGDHPEMQFIRPQWLHPFLLAGPSKQQNLSEQEFSSFAYGYYLKFLPYFPGIHGGITIELSRRLKRILGSADLKNRVVALNWNYFRNTPHLVPYTIFHELTHLWLYDCNYDPSHTRRFYAKMAEFEETGLPIDNKVHIHRRLVTEGKHISQCPCCKFKWFTQKKMRLNTICRSCKVSLVTISK